MKNFGAAAMGAFVLVCFVPTFILALSAFKFAKPDEISFYLGLGIFSAGASILAAALGAFAKESKALADQSEAQSALVVSGVYAYVRNPADIGIAAMLLGESVFFGSALILLWLFMFFALKSAYIIFLEEPRLAKRFGGKYFDYARNVGRWIPRKRPWIPDSR